MLRTSNLGFRVFSDAERQELHSAALEVLEHVGVEIHSERALEVARRAAPTSRATAPGSRRPLVDKCIRSAPSRVVLCDRNGSAS